MDKEISKRNVLKFLKEKDLSVISTVSPTGKPESATVIYFIDDDLNFYFVTRHNTRKFRNLQSNKNVAIVVGVELKPVTVQIEGTAELVSDEKGKSLLMAEIIKRPQIKSLYFGPFLELDKDPVFKLDKDGDFAGYKVKINWLRWLSIDPETGREEYLQVI